VAGLYLPLFFFVVSPKIDISQLVSASWNDYGSSSGVGIWGGHMVFYNGEYWHFFGNGDGRIFFVKA
jgi:hypothetical protein